MTRFFQVTANNPCIICGDISGDCRTQDDLILCHSFIEQDSPVAGYKFLKTSSNFVWGVHVPDNGKEFDREKYDRYLEQKAQQERNQKQFLYFNALSSDGRDKAIRKLSRYVGLSDCHREDLIRRGLSVSDIEAGLFFSIDPWVRFNLDLPDNLPGIHALGDRFSTRDFGYACPIFDKQGRAHGWQLRVEGVTKGNKYKWAKSNFSSKLPNDEYPITHIPSLNNPHRLVLTEGILKPYITAKSLTQSVCGASGGYFSGSRKQFREIQADYSEFAIAPDAGDVLNPQVMERWEKQALFLKQFNKPIKVLWWGQIDKNQHQDIDEIDEITFSEAQHLAPQEFFDLAKKQQFIKQQWQNWRNYKKFTPQVKIDKKFIEYGLPEKHTITFIKSGLGTGKTTQLINHLNQLENEAIINLGYRNTLLLQFNENTKEINFYHLQSDKKLKEFSLHDPELKVSLCIDSLIYFVTEQFDGKIVIIDEIVSALKHLLFSSTIKNFAKVKELFSEMANRADRLILLDGFMADWAVNFFKELCPDKKIITIENTFKGDKPKIYLLEGTIDLDEKIRTNDKSPWLEGLLNSDCPVVASDSQLFCEAMDNLLSSQGKKGIRVDSKTVSEKYIKEFFTDPDKWIGANQPDYLIYSPSAESGLDIPTKNYFTEQFCFFFGSLDVDSCIQMIGRIRDVSVPRYIWCKQFIQSEDFTRRPSNIESIQSDRARNLMAELNLLTIASEFLSKEEIISSIQEIYRDNLDCYTTAADTIKAIRNHEFSNYRECLKKQLIDCGYQLESLKPRSPNEEKAIALKEKEAKTEVKEQNSRDIYQASDRYIGKPNSCLNFDASWSDRCAVEKAKIIDRLPEINKNEVWSANFIKLIKYDNPQLIRQIESYYLLENPNIAEKIAINKYSKFLGRGIAAPWKLRPDYLRIKALRDIGLYDWHLKAISTNNYSYNLESLEVQFVLRKCSYRKNKQILGAPGKDKLKFFNNLLRSLGIVIKSKRVRNGGSIDRIYSIDQDSLISKEKLAIYQAIKMKYAEKVNLINSSSDSIENSLKKLQKFSEHPFEKIQPESIDTQSLKSDPHQANFIYKNKTKWITLNTLNSPDSDPMEKDNTSKIQDLLDSNEAIADLASYLEVIESADELAELQTIEGVTPDRLKVACRLLPPKKIAQIKDFAIANHKKRNPA